MHLEVSARLVAPLYTTDKLKPLRMREDIFPVAMAMADPVQAAAWLNRYVAAAKGDELRHILQPWEMMAPAVAGDDATFWEALHRHVLHCWWPYVKGFLRKSLESVALRRQQAPICRPVGATVHR